MDSVLDSARSTKCSICDLSKKEQKSGITLAPNLEYEDRVYLGYIIGKMSKYLETFYIYDTINVFTENNLKRL